jgi:ATP synthase protein I
MAHRSPKPEWPSEGRDGGMSPFTVYALYGGAGIQLAVSVIAGLLLGGWADGHFGTRPWLALAGVVLGFIGGLANLIRIVEVAARRRK